MSELGTLTDKLFIANELPVSQLRQAVQIPGTALQSPFYGLLDAAARMAFFCPLFFDCVKQFVDFSLIEVNAPQKCNDLLFQVILFDALLSANDITLLVPTVVVHVVASVMIDLFFCGDEGDFRFSDEKAEIVKILNNGNARGFPVLRSESVNSREFSPRAYAVFGPKLVSTRGFFQDRALESRCLTEETGGRRLRDDIPLNLTAEYQREALAIRNELLMFRIRNFGRRTIDATLVDRSIEPRLSQIFVPLLSVIDDAEARQALREVAREYHRELVADRGMDLEAQVLEIIQELRDSPYTDGLSIKEIAERMADRYGDDFERKVTPHWIGYVVRRRLGLKTEKRHGSYAIATSEETKLARLLEKYGISTGDPPSGDSGDLGDFTKGTEAAPGSAGPG